MGRRVGRFLGVPLLALLWVLSVALSGAWAAQVLLDKSVYSPGDKMVITVKDSDANVNAGAQDTVTVTITTSSGESIQYVLREIGNDAGIFTTQNDGNNNEVDANEYPVWNPNYQPCYAANEGSWSKVDGVCLNPTIAYSTSGDATLDEDAVLKVAPGDTITVSYGDVTATAQVAYHTGEVTVSPSSIDPGTADPGATNLTVLVKDPDLNKNPKVKECIYLEVLDANEDGTPDSVWNLVEVRDIDSTGAIQNQVGEFDIDTFVNNHGKMLLLCETGVNSGEFVATGRVWTGANNAGNVNIATANAAANNGVITFPDVNSDGDNENVQIYVLAASSGATITATNAATTLQIGTTPVTCDVTDETKCEVLVNVGDAQNELDPGDVVLLQDGSVWAIFIVINNDADENFTGSSATISTQDFTLDAEEIGDTIKVCYLDNLMANGLAATATTAPCATASYGVSGVTGSLSLDRESVSIGERLKVTLTDPNLNTSATTAEQVQNGYQVDYNTGAAGDNQGTVTVRAADGALVKNKVVRIYWVDDDAPPNDEKAMWLVTTDSNGQAAISDSNLVFKTAALDYDSQDAGNDNTVDGGTFTAVVDGQVGTVEVSVDQEHWVTLSLTETAVNSGNFSATVSFDHTTYDVAADGIDADGTQSFSGPNAYADPSKLTEITLTAGANNFAVGDVIRVFTKDRMYSEITTVLYVDTNNNRLYVEQLDLENTFEDVDANAGDVMVQRIGMDNANTLGAFYGATYYFRYNDQYNDSNEAEVIDGGSVNFVTHTATVTFEPAEAIAPNQFLTITLTDPDLNTDPATAQQTWDDNDNNDNTDRYAEFQPDSKEVIVTTASSYNTIQIGTNAITIQLRETGVNTGVFKNAPNSLRIVLGSSNTNNSPVAGPKVLGVNDGDTIYVYYYDAPSAESAIPVGQVYSYFAGPAVQSSIGTISTNVDEAYIRQNSDAQAPYTGQTIVVTVTDADANTDPNSRQNVNVTVISSTDSSGITVQLQETGLNTGVFRGTFTLESGPGATSDDATDRLQVSAGDTVRITYADGSTTPATEVTKDIPVRNFDATLTLDAESYNLGSSVTVTVTDPEANENYNAKDSITVTVFTNSDPVGVTMTLIETDLDSGVFTKSFTVSEEDSIANARVKAAVGDTLTVRYIENVAADGNQATRTATATIAEAPACSSDNLTACTTQADCENAGGYWYNDACHAEPQAEPQPEEACSSDNLTACTTQNDCTGAGGYWYEDACHAEVRSVTLEEFTGPVAEITYAGEAKAHVDIVHPMAVPEDDQGQSKTVYFVIGVGDALYAVEKTCALFFCTYELVPYTGGDLPSLGQMSLGSVLDLSNLLDEVKIGESTYNFNDLPLSDFTGEVQVYVGYATGDDRGFVLTNYTVVME